MNLINVDGLALIGPGSEWFWSMLQFVVVAITLFAIFRQVSLQTSAGAIQQATGLQGDWHSSERLMRSRLAVLVALRDGMNPATTARAAANEVGNFWERVGYLVKAGHINRRLVHVNRTGFDGDSISWRMESWQNTNLPARSQGGIHPN